MVKSFMEFRRDLKPTICITHITLRVAFLEIRIYLHFRDLHYSLRTKCETLFHQEPDTCYDQIRYYELSKRNNLE